MVSGSVATIEYGEPRATLDVDIAILLETDQADQMPAMFSEPEYYCPPADVLHSELSRPSRGHFNVIHIPSGLKADFYPSRNHPLFDWAMSNRRKILIAGQDVLFAPPEYVVLWKLEFFREGAGDKHLRDIKGILAVSQDEIDKPFISIWAHKLGLGGIWEELID
jgi:hypothetical protein